MQTGGGSGMLYNCCLDRVIVDSDLGWDVRGL